jgi:glycosyltransferase involved in cell wall biosynthesis
MPNISITIHTASKDDFLFARQGVRSALASYLDCLNHQTLDPSEFEFVVVDLFWPDNRAILDQAPHRFAVKYVPCVRDYWRNRKLIGIASAKNSGLVFSEGELVVSCDDAELLPPQFLEVFWKHYREGRFAHAVHRRLTSVRCTDGRIAFPIEGAEYVNDHRYEHVRAGVHPHDRGSWLYAGASYTLADALAMNGHNERLDGCKSLEDCEFGRRLENLGRRFVLDPACFLWILDHSADYRAYLGEMVSKDNYGFLEMNDRFKETRANHRALRPEELEIINQQTQKFRKFSLDFQDPEVRAWVDYPVFSLEEERKRRLDEWYAGKYDAP